MKLVRPRLFVLALLVTGAQVAALASGTLAVCCMAMGSATIAVTCTCPHDGEVGESCPMHRPAGHDHEDSSDASEDTCRIGACGHSGGVLVVLAIIGILPPATESVLFLVEVSALVPLSDEVLDGLFPPASPPPRA
jgi:hypothetical protein